DVPPPLRDHAGEVCAGGEDRDVGCPSGPCPPDVRVGATAERPQGRERTAPCDQGRLGGGPGPRREGPPRVVRPVDRQGSRDDAEGLHEALRGLRRAPRALTLARAPCGAPDGSCGRTEAPGAVRRRRDLPLGGPDAPGVLGELDVGAAEPLGLDRKSTRLNSSHVSISYAVFCLKKKNVGTE